MCTRTFADVLRDASAEAKRKAPAFFMWATSPTPPPFVHGDAQVELSNWELEINHDLQMLGPDTPSRLLRDNYDNLEWIRAAYEHTRIDSHPPQVQP